jgi:hypothetical protein
MGAASGFKMHLQIALSIAKEIRPISKIFANLFNRLG